MEELPDRLARRAGALRALARQGSAADAIVVATAEPGGVVLTSDLQDLRALAGHSSVLQLGREFEGELVGDLVEMRGHELGVFLCCQR